MYSNVLILGYVLPSKKKDKSLFWRSPESSLCIILGPENNHVYVTLFPFEFVQRPCAAKLVAKQVVVVVIILNKSIPDYT